MVTSLKPPPSEIVQVFFRSSLPAWWFLQKSSVSGWMMPFFGLSPSHLQTPLIEGPFLPSAQGTDFHSPAEAAPSAAASPFAPLPAPERGAAERLRTAAVFAGAPA